MLCYETRIPRLPLRDTNNFISQNAVQLSSPSMQPPLHPLTSFSTGVVVIQLPLSDTHRCYISLNVTDRCFYLFSFLFVITNHCCSIRLGLYYSCGYVAVCGPAVVFIKYTHVQLCYVLSCSVIGLTLCWGLSIKFVTVTLYKKSLSFPL